MNITPTSSSSFSELVLDDDLSGLKSLPVHATKYNDILRWHVKPGTRQVHIICVYKTMRLVPLYSIANAFCVAYWVEHPAVIVKFILAKLSSVEHSAVAGLVDFMMVRAINSKLFVRAVHSITMTALEKIPTSGFLKSTCSHTIHSWSGLAIFPGATPNMLPVIRLASYLDLPHPPYETFNSEQEYIQRISQMTFERMTSDIRDAEAASWSALVGLVRSIGKPDLKNDIALPFPVHPAEKFCPSEFQMIRFPSLSTPTSQADEDNSLGDDLGGSNGFELFGVESKSKSRSPTNITKLLPIIEDESE